MSYRPHGFGLSAPTGGSLPAAFPVCQAYSFKVDAVLPTSAVRVASSPKLYAVVVPARQQYSHSASVGKRISSSVASSFSARSISVNFRQNSRASRQENISTELRDPFQRLGFRPTTDSYRFCGTSYLAIAK